MSRIAYVNGRYAPHAEAGVHIEDRAFQFGDGVYEVCEVRRGALIDEARHLARLGRSLDALRIAAPLAPAAMGFVLREVVARNRVIDGLVYFQVSRGAARRDFPFPSGSVQPSLVVTAKSIDPRLNEERARNGIAVICVQNERWSRPDIKSLQLLPNVLAKQAARDAGAYEAWLLDADGQVMEGASSNAWIVTPDGALVTRYADQAILRGVTRTTLLDLAAAEGLQFVERAFNRTEALGAAEAFMSSATTIALPIIAIDGHAIGAGRPGPVVAGLRRRFHRYAKASAP